MNCADVSSLDGWWNGARSRDRGARNRAAGRRHPQGRPVLARMIDDSRGVDASSAFSNRRASWARVGRMSSARSCDSNWRRHAPVMRLLIERPVESNHAF